MRNVFRLKGVVPLLIMGTIATLIRLFPQAIQYVIDTTGVNTQAAPLHDSEYWQLVPGSVYDGDTLRVQRNGRELRIRVCGIDAPEIEQPMGVEARDHLRSLISQGDGTVIVLRVETDRYGRTVAELFVPVVDREEDIHLNSQMTLDGFAYHYEQYSDSCPNQDAIARGEAMAKAARAGVWMDPNAVKPWEYRQQSKAY